MWEVPSRRYKRQSFLRSRMQQKLKEATFRIFKISTCIIATSPQRLTLPHDSCCKRDSYIWSSFRFAPATERWHSVEAEYAQQQCCESKHWQNFKFLRDCRTWVLSDSTRRSCKFLSDMFYGFRDKHLKIVWENLRCYFPVKNYRTHCVNLNHLHI